MPSSIESWWSDCSRVTFFGEGGRKSSLSRSESGVLGSTVRLPNCFSSDGVQEDGNDGTVSRGLFTKKLQMAKVRTLFKSITLHKFASPNKAFENG